MKILILFLLSLLLGPQASAVPEDERSSPPTEADRHIPPGGPCGSGPSTC